MREAVAIGLGALGLLAVGGLAYAATRSTPAPATGSAGGAAGGTTASLPAGSPAGLLSSGPTATGWAMHIAIQPNTSGLSYQGFFADVITVSLPAGAHWRANTGAGNTPAMGPQSGTADFTFVLVEPMTYSFAYTDANNTNQGTTLSFALGGTFASTTRLSLGDYVILAFAAQDALNVAAALQTALQAGQGTAEQQQEAATLQVADALVGGTPTQAMAIQWMVSLGPFADAFSPDVRALVGMAPGTAIPTWWPSDDTSAATEYHVVYRYIGQGVDVSALPIPTKAWKRVA